MKFLSNAIPQIFFQLVYVSLIEPKMMGLYIFRSDFVLLVRTNLGQTEGKWQTGRDKNTVRQRGKLGPLEFQIAHLNIKRYCDIIVSNASYALHNTL